MSAQGPIRLGADIGGTFTDVVLDIDGRVLSTKVLTQYAAPEQAILDGLSQLCDQAGITPGALDLVIHGTTLATNALIERRGARTAFVTTKGFRDVIEMRTENRFAQYDLNITLPPPLVPRQDRFAIAGRIDAKGRELQALDDAALHELGPRLAQAGYGALAIGFLHSYLNPDHETRARDILSEYVDIPISISSEVSPQMREFERFNTVCANAYVRPQMASYLGRLQVRLAEMGAACPVFMIHSGGGLISVETAAKFPVRLVESGPAGGAIFAADIARRFGLGSVVSYDMGGTTAKICLIEDFQPRTARSFEVARTYRFAKGSGMPISIPVIEMIEIGAGGGSLASVDAMGRIQTGPESAGSEPGPACYQHGGTRPAITDADLLLGKLDPANFAGGRIRLSPDHAARAIEDHVAAPLGLDAKAAAFGVVEVVDENMANAARVHAVENGKDISGHAMIAFGGAAPLHAARLCEKLGIDLCLIPRGAGVGSAIGFLKTPFGYEALSSTVMLLDAFDGTRVADDLAALTEMAERFVRAGTDCALRREVTAFMRYAGQGWEIPVTLPDGGLGADAPAMLRDLFETAYAGYFGRAIAGARIQIVTWSVRVQEIRSAPARLTLDPVGQGEVAGKARVVFDADRTEDVRAQEFDRDDLSPGARIRGPAVITETETATLVSSSFDAVIQEDGSILLVRKGAGDGAG